MCTSARRAVILGYRSVQPTFISALAQDSFHASLSSRAVTRRQDNRPGAKRTLFALRQDGGRPSTKFLAARIYGRAAARLGFSTEQKRWFKRQLRLSLYWTGISWAIAAGGLISLFYLHEDWLDKLHPSPSEWSFLARFSWRAAQHELAVLTQGGAGVDWGKVGSNFYNAIVALESDGGFLFASQVPLRNAVGWEAIDFPGFDKDLMRREPSFQSGLGELSRIGMDVSQQSEIWRRAYFDALMGLAKAAEMDHGWVIDRTRRMAIPRNMVIGPSNPNPMPMPPGQNPSPLEENCIPAFNDPVVYYTRILTTQGLTRRQRLDAGLALASWFDFQGSTATSLKLHSWCLQMTAHGSSSGSDMLVADQVVNTSTGVIAASTPVITANILKASEALAQFHARNGNPADALAAYLSILRAYDRSPWDAASRPAEEPDYSLSNIESFLTWVRALPRHSDMGPAPPSGDDTFRRGTGADCKSASIMAHIGEIIFTSGKDRILHPDRRNLEGLNWTRNAVAVADAAVDDATLDNESRRLCNQCLDAGLENWLKMVEAVVGKKELTHGIGSPWSRSLESLLPQWLTGSQASYCGSDKSADDWEQERRYVVGRTNSRREEKLFAILDQQIQSKGRWINV